MLLGFESERSAILGFVSADRGIGGKVWVPWVGAGSNSRKRIQKRPQQVFSLGAFFLNANLG